MRIRFWLYLTFGFFSILPLLLMGVWFHTNLTQNELAKAGKAQLALAETQADSVERYLNTQKVNFETDLAEIKSGKLQTLNASHAKVGNIKRILIIDLNTGLIDKDINLGKANEIDNMSGRQFGMSQLNKLKAYGTQTETTVSPIIKHANGSNCIYLIRIVAGKLIAGEINTDFFHTLASGTRIGASGHAAIFDQMGNLISHPNPDWQATGKNIKKLSPVIMANDGDNGITNFFSPAVEKEMLAGVATVGDTHWGVMIPRTVDDIISDTGFAKASVSIMFTLIVAAILLGTIIVSNFISNPMERLTSQVRKIKDGDDLAEIQSNQKLKMPSENRELEKTFAEMAGKLRKTHDRMKVLAYSDAVTGLVNREAFSEIVEKSLALMANKDLSGALLFIDIDNFKEINDAEGHAVGDQVLRSLGTRIGSILELATGKAPSKILESNIDENGIPKPCVARFGGDEFVVFIPENNGLAQLEMITKQILEAIEAPVPGSKSDIVLKGRIGISSFPEHGLTCRDLVKKADIAVNHAKSTGKRRVQKYGDGTGELSAGELRRDVHLAITNNELELYYQPKVNTVTNNVKSVEALVRWFHPKKGLISPADFIPAIENSDITNELGEWVMRRACQDMKLWESQGQVLDIAVNIASRQFSSDDFVERIQQIVIDEECEPTRFEIEVTEEAALSMTDSTHSIISRLHELGFKVSLDDYGRGYSNLTRLSELRVNTIKIDGPLTARLTRDARTRVIFEATINMAKGLNCDTVAEGVETAEEVAILTKLGCTELQGFYFATPMPQASVLNWIDKRHARTVNDMQEQIKVAI